MSNDLVNGLFEFAGALFILRHCFVLYRQKALSGVSILSTVYFFSWGVWNLFYYPALNQMWSFWGGVAIMFANCFWIGMMFYYRHRKIPVAPGNIGQLRLNSSTGTLQVFAKEGWLDVALGLPEDPRDEQEKQLTAST